MATTRHHLSAATFVGLLGLALATSACDSGGGRGPDPDPPTAQARLLVTADTNVLEPSAEALSPTALEALANALPARAVEAHYVLTTPAAEPFAFDLLTWSEGAAGTVGVRVAHVRDGDTDPVGDPASLPAAGIAPEGRSLTTADRWLGVEGDGLARLSLKGRIERDQMLAVATGDGPLTLVELRIGDRSRINRDLGDGEEPTDDVTTQTIYSSNSRRFGMPSIAVSGDRTSIVCYEGDRESEFAPSRFEMRLQHDASTGVVTGGGSVGTELDGYWRDHEIAALHNVLAAVRASSSAVRLRLSFDRGATFAQEVELPTNTAQSRLVQIAMAADYSLAVAYWRTNTDTEALEFVLVEGRPSAADGTGSPTWFAFDAPQLLRTAPLGSGPLTTGIAWSEGGDLVVGYGASTFTPDFVGWRSRTEFRCVVRRWGEALEDRLVDVEEIFGMDPTVAVLGSGDSMRIYYAYEVQQGLRLAHSDDGGRTFVRGEPFGQPGDHLPAVFAREAGGAVRLDVLYLASRQGTELHHSRWLDGPGSPREDFALTRAHLETSAQPVQGMFWAGPTVRLTQVSWLGFDAVLDGDSIVAVYDEETIDGIVSCWASVGSAATAALGPGIFASPFQAAAPPPLAPGMTEPVPPANPDHAHQLKLLRIE